jgi:hypothetical protein
LDKLGRITYTSRQPCVEGDTEAAGLSPLAFSDSDGIQKSDGILMEMKSG